MKLRIVASDSIDTYSGQMSRKTYDSIPKNKRPTLSTDSTFSLGDLIKPVVTVRVVDEANLELEFMYLHPEAINVYYKDKEYIDLE